MKSVRKKVLGANVLSTIFGNHEKKLTNQNCNIWIRFTGALARTGWRNFVFEQAWLNKVKLKLNLVEFFCFTAVHSLDNFTWIRLRWLRTVSCIFQHLNFDGSMPKVFFS